MSAIFFDDFDDGLVGNPPTNWSVQGNVTVQEDPAPDHGGDKAMRMMGAGQTQAVATRNFDAASGEVEVALKFYVGSATTPPLMKWIPFQLRVMEVDGLQDPRIALVAGLVLDTDGSRSFVVFAGENSYVVFGEWQVQTWHELILRFTVVPPQIWGFSPMKRVEIEFDGSIVSYGWPFNPEVSSLDTIHLVAASSLQLETPLNSTIYIDDVFASREDWAMPDELICPAKRFCWIDAEDVASIRAYKVVYGGSSTPNNYVEGFEPENMLHQHLGKEWRSLDPNPYSGYTVADHWIDVDLGEPRVIEAISILNHNLADLLFLVPTEPPREVVLLAKNEGDNNWQYKYWLLDSLVLGSVFRAMLGGDERTPLGWTNTTIFPNKAYRCWRILIRQYKPTGSSGTSKEYFKIGRLLMGTISELVYNFEHDWQIDVADPSAEAESIVGARWFREIPTRRRIRVSFSLDDENWAEIETQLALLRRVPRLYILAPVEFSSLHALSIYGTLSNNPVSVEVRSLQDHFWDYELEIAEEVW